MDSFGTCEYAFAKIRFIIIIRFIILNVFNKLIIS